MIGFIPLKPPENDFIQDLINEASLSVAEYEEKLLRRILNDYVAPVPENEKLEEYFKEQGIKGVMKFIDHKPMSYDNVAGVIVKNHLITPDGKYVPIKKGQPQWHRSWKMKKLPKSKKK